MTMLENVKNLPLKKINYEIDFFKTLVTKYGKESFYDQLKDLDKSINLKKLSKLHKDAYDLLQVRSKAFLQELQENEWMGKNVSFFYWNNIVRNEFFLWLWSPRQESHTGC